jgi:hypothetical protein
MKRSLTVRIPHLNYTVRFRPYKKPPASIPRAFAWVRHDDRHSCTIFMSKNEQAPSLAHELVHVLHYICNDRYMHFEDEFEHMAYLMQYLMGKAMGYEYTMN